MGEAEVGEPAHAAVLTERDEPLGSEVSDEDCLYLNLFTPALDGSRPVIVWIYGGGFEVGTASPPMTDVAALARATGTVTESDIGRRNLPGGRAWGVVLDGSVLDRHPTAAVRAGAAAHLPLLVSTNRDEIKAFEKLPGFTPADSGALLADIRQAGVGRPAELLAAYRARHPQAGLTELRSRFLSDAIYIVPADRLAEAQVDAGGAAYRAVFAAEPFGPEAGTPHGMDIMYIFDLLDASNMGTPPSHAVRDDLHQAWRRFAETGEPGWPRYDPGATGNARVLGAPGGLTTEPARDEVTAHWR